MKDWLIWMHLIEIWHLFLQYRINWYRDYIFAWLFELFPYDPFAELWPRLDGIYWRSFLSRDTACHPRTPQRRSCWTRHLIPEQPLFGFYNIHLEAVLTLECCLISIRIVQEWSLPPLLFLSRHTAHGIAGLRSHSWPKRGLSLRIVTSWRLLFPYTKNWP